jgi:uncharacterized membrane protein
MVEPYAPQLTVTVGLFLTLVSFGSLILLVQHISTMLQAPNIAAAAGSELQEVVLAEMPERVIPGDNCMEGSKLTDETLVETAGYPICVRQSGSIQYIDPEYIIELAREHDLVIRLLRKPGDIVWRDVRVALVWPARHVDEDLEHQIRNAFRIGNGRTPTQDVVYAFNQLVEMAVRAMSPAINDPFTAMTCLNYIGEGLALFINQGEKSPCLYDQDHQLRLILKPVTFIEVLDNALTMIRHASCDNASVLLHMLEVIHSISQEVQSASVNRELIHHICLIQDESKAGSIIESDRGRIDQRCTDMISSLQANIS